MIAIEDVSLAYQSMFNLTGLRSDMLQNAKNYITIAQAQSSPVATLSAMIQGDAQGYLYRCNLQTTLKNDATNGPKLVDGLTRFGMAQSDLDTPTSEMQTVAQILSTADLSTYAAIISAAQAVINSLPPYASLFG